MSEIMDQHVICDELTHLVLCVGVAVWLSCGGDFGPVRQTVFFGL
jgi:hypothetical protein